MFGDGIYFVAIAWEVYHLSSSPTAYGVVGAAFSLPQVLFVLAGGVISDRLNRRVLMMVASLVSAVAIGLLGVLVVLHADALWMIVVLVFIYGSSQALFTPASTALTPSLVPTELLPQATAMNQVLQPITLGVIGPAVGGLIIAAYGTGAAFLLDSATFAVAVATMALMSGGAIDRAAEEGPLRKASALHEAREALGFVRSQPWIWAGMLSAAIANMSFSGPLSVLLPYVVKYDLHGTASDLGLIFAVSGLGAVAAAVYVIVKGTPRHSVTWIFVAWTGANLAMTLVGHVTASWQLMVIGAIIFGGLTIGNLIWSTLMGLLVPNAMLGRVSSFDWMVSFSLTPISNALTGPIAGLVGVGNTLLGGGLIGGIVTLAALFLPGVRDPEKVPAPTSA